jgi:photosystem II stability/assembly factor-like uncharacterized protein
MRVTVVLMGSRKGLFLARSTDRRSWDLSKPLFSMNSVGAVAADLRRSPPRLLAGTDSPHWGPSVFTSDDLGKTWSDSEGGAIRFPAATEAALAAVWQLQPGLDTEPDVVWAGVEPAALFRSTDGGATYSLVEGLWNHPHRDTWMPGGGGQCLHTIVLHPDDPARVMVGISTGGVYRTADGGATWAPSNSGIEARFYPDIHPEYGQCVHRIAHHPDRPDQLFLQNHGGVYRSDDGGTTWIDIAAGLPGDFGFPVVVHPHRPGTVYLFPQVADANRVPPEGRPAVYRSTDAGDTWERLDGGLPSAGAWGLTVLRGAMGTDAGDPAGVYFGTRTGEVYVALDGEDHWNLVARHLPDVLSVRAATVA